MADQRGVEVLALPAGFSYVTFGHIGAPMSDGTPTPLALDGMAAFAGPHGGVRLIRNHEDRNPAGAGSVPGDPARSYDAQGGGGTSTLDYDPHRRRLVADYVSLSGTTTNCAGGIAYRKRGWISCEESVGGPAHTDPKLVFPRRHGYCYEVPLTRGPRESHQSRPIPAMGRFSHEAIAVDQRTGIVYLTEDPGAGVGAGFYRLPADAPAASGAGGSCRCWASVRRPGRSICARARRSATRWRSPGTTSTTPIPSTWCSTTPGARSTRATTRAGRSSTGSRAAGTTTARCISSPRAVVTPRTATSTRTATGRASARCGSTGRARATGVRLTLWYESPSGDVLDSPDNLTVTPRGGLVLCEDDAATAYNDTHPAAPGISQVNRLIGLTPDGDAFEFAVNRFSESELAGACFSPDGQTMFFNIFGASEGTRGRARGPRHDHRGHRPLAGRAALTHRAAGRAFRRSTVRREVPLPEPRGHELAGVGRSAAAHEPRDGGHQLVRLLALHRPLGAPSRSGARLVQQPEGHLVESCLSGADLREDVDAVAILLHPALNAAHLCPSMRFRRLSNWSLLALYPPRRS